MNNQALAYIRAQVAKFHTDTCDIYSPSVGVDDSGSFSTTPSLVASGVKCRLITAGTSNSSATAMPGSRETLVEEYRLSVPYGTTLGVDYEVEINETRYQVVRILSDLTDKVDVQAIVTKRRS